MQRILIGSVAFWVTFSFLVFAQDEGARKILVKPLQQGAPGRLEFSIDKGCGAVYRYGEKLHVKVKSERDGYLTIFDFCTDGTVQIIFPNAYHTDNFVKGGVEYTIPGDLLPFEFEVAPPDGEEVLFAVVTQTKRDLLPDQVYDFSKVFPQLPGSPSQEAERISRGVEIIPAGEWWAAAMCFFHVGEPQKKAERWGLFVGINNYLSEVGAVGWIPIEGSLYTLPNLAYAVADAHAMAAALADAFPHQRVLTDAQATFAAIRDAITGWLATAPEDATVLVFFAGHGARLKDKNADEVDGWDETLVAYDRQVILDEILVEWLATLRAQRIVVILDTSHGGSTDRNVRTFRIGEEERSKFPPLKDGFGEDLVKWPSLVDKVVVLTACRPDQQAQEVPALGHGAFTYYLLQGVQGAADANKDGSITVQELHFYAAAEARRVYRQEPQMHDGAGKPVVLVDSPQRSDDLAVMDIRKEGCA